jgi:dTDP-glucose pyrophosphorylase
LHNIMSEITIILCGGSINYFQLPVGTNLSNAMIPVNGKPVICWILDDLLEKGINEVIIVLRELDSRLQAFLQVTYVTRMSITMVPLVESETIIQSLQAGLVVSPASGRVRVILGDTLIHDDYQGAGDFVYVGQVADSRRWCLALLDDDQRVQGYADKQIVSGDEYWALAGYYQFEQGAALCACVTESLAAGEKELSAVLHRYGMRHPITARKVQEWYDFGHIDNLVDARRRLLAPRHFNSLQINPILNTITKTSENNDILQDELNWYLNLPDELKVLAPRILSHKQVNGKVEISQEYYGYPTLAELYVFGELGDNAWVSILRHVLRIHQEFKRYSIELDREQFEEMYITKTFARLEQLQQYTEWPAILRQETVVINGKELRNLPILTNAIHQRVHQIAGSSVGNIIHGDFCFSNILFDINNQIIRLIDPRGNFGRKGIYGDPRYDMAKLRHSVCGQYDFIVANMFEIQQVKNGFNWRIFANSMQETLAPIFDDMLNEYGYNLDDIRFIEGLLFISMLPLHKDYPNRQRMMYSIGISLLNEVL